MLKWSKSFFENIYKVVTFTNYMKFEAEGVIEKRVEIVQEKVQYKKNLCEKCKAWKPLITFGQYHTCQYLCEECASKQC